MKDQANLHFQIANEFPDGVHAIIYVMNGDTRFTAEEAETVRVVRVMRINLCAHKFLMSFFSQINGSSNILTSCHSVFYQGHVS